ncbi:unnamed protein product [Nippostrongylus brasiliensis]|uniref:Uncharacterized protein n=1 Tax=Nippostrongylus brasiliensis TaxID=27835 RepID=A0A0N4YBB6_NIPBR|nr:unnamed protein product [Nippostrongylus brasiliensis]
MVLTGESKAYSASIMEPFAAVQVLEEFLWFRQNVAVTYLESPGTIQLITVTSCVQSRADRSPIALSRSGGFDLATPVQSISAISPMDIWCQDRSDVDEWGKTFTKSPRSYELWQSIR